MKNRVTGVTEISSKGARVELFDATKFRRRFKGFVSVYFGGIHGSRRSTAFLVKNQLPRNWSEQNVHLSTAVNKVPLKKRPQQGGMLKHLTCWIVDYTRLHFKSNRWFHHAGGSIATEYTTLVFHSLPKQKKQVAKLSWVPYPPSPNQSLAIMDFFETPNIGWKLRSMFTLPDC